MAFCEGMPTNPVFQTKGRCMTSPYTNYICEITPQFLFSYALIQSTNNNRACHKFWPCRCYYTCTVKMENFRQTRVISLEKTVVNWPYLEVISTAHNGSRRLDITSWSQTSPFYRSNTVTTKQGPSGRRDPNFMASVSIVTLTEISVSHDVLFIRW